jgi:enoyl-CoA hydratase/carnithine racemase
MSTTLHCRIVIDGPIAHLTLDRPEKHNAVNDALLDELAAFFGAPPTQVQVAVLSSTGTHFCAGLDLSEHEHRSAVEVVHHSQYWHRVTRSIQLGRLPVVAAMQGAVLGGGLEIASATHVRVADETAFYGLPEGQRGIYVGGGASVRVGRMIGADRMREMMLTGRTYNAEEGNRLGLSHHLVPAGQALEKATALAEQIASNAPLSNYAMLHALPRIADMTSDDGYFVESLMAGLVQTSDEARQRIDSFLNRKKNGG